VSEREAQGLAPPEEVAHAGFRGAIAAMAMTGMRVVTVDLGIVKERAALATDHLRYGLILSETRRRPQD